MESIRNLKSKFLDCGIIRHNLGMILQQNEHLSKFSVVKLQNGQIQRFLFEVVLGVNFKIWECPGFCCVRFHSKFTNTNGASISIKLPHSVHTGGPRVHDKQLLQITTLPGRRYGNCNSNTKI
jgi:hypothetical protein